MRGGLAARNGLATRDATRPVGFVTPAYPTRRRLVHAPRRLSLGRAPRQLSTTVGLVVGWSRQQLTRLPD